jgi:hypothetical protein
MFPLWKDFIRNNPAPVRLRKFYEIGTAFSFEVIVADHVVGDGGFRA